MVGGPEESCEAFFFGRAGQSADALRWMSRFERAKALLAMMGSRSIYCGDSGNGLYVFPFLVSLIYSY